MRKVLTVLASMATMFVAATPAWAAPQTGSCTVRRYSYGVSQCSFIVTGSEVSLWHWQAVGDTSATMNCTLGSASRETTGQTWFTGTGQCTVSVYVWTTPGDGLATGNSHIG